MTRTFFSRTAVAAALTGLGLMVASGFLAMDRGDASAQGAPPTMPTVYYGTASGAAVGSSVVAVIGTGGSSTVCGYGKVLNNGGPVYAIQVATDDQADGCGAPGRQVRFYVTSDGPGNGRLSGSTNWTSGPSNPVYTQQYNLNLGAPLSNVLIVPSTARTVAQ